MAPARTRTVAADGEELAGGVEEGAGAGGGMFRLTGSVRFHLFKARPAAPLAEDISDGEAIKTLEQ